MNLQKPHFIDLHQDIAHTPQDHVSIDFLGPLHLDCSMQPHRLSYDHPYQGQKTTTVATHLFLDIM